MDGPPYTSGSIHLGTAWNKALKDAIIRYYTMLGYNVWRQPGWDMHGLPIEVLVEKKLGFKTKKDIEEYGVDKFIEECRKFALQNLKIMEQQFKRLGVWMDWDNPYMTIRREYMECEWWTFKRAWDRGLIEKDYRVVHWCPRCETALADHEIEYKVLRDPSIYVKFPLENRENEFILIWTTTPWTLPANMGVMVHPDFDYVKVKVLWNGQVEYWWFAKGRLEEVMREIGVEEFEIVEEVKGSELDGLRYIHPFLEEYPKQKEFRKDNPRVHTIVLAEFVSLEEGTGCVHSAPGHGEEDFEVSRRYNIPVYCPVDKDGKYFEGAWKGLYVKDADRYIIENLHEKGLLVYSGTVEHRYPICWRCKSPILFRATEQWFLRVSKIKDKIISENAKNVQWLPSWVRKRYEDGVRNVGDWVISRQRYWNVPIPIWKCEKCGNLVVIGSLDELKKLAKNDVPDDIDLHRPWIDQVILVCPKCKGDMKRISDVLDVWFDSGVAGWASLGYPKRRELFDKLWPADLVLEGQDQVLKWFYSQQVLSIVAFDTVPYRKVAMHGFVLDAAGSKMSKSLGNIVMPEEVIEKYGADTLRLYLLSTTLPWEDIRFKWEEVKEVRDALDILWNVFYMVATYMELDKFNPSNINVQEVMAHMLPEDKWLLSRVDSLVKTVGKCIEDFQIARGVRELLRFIVDDLSRWYGKLVRRRFWIERDDPVKLAAYYTVYLVFKKLLAVLAVFAPFIAEEIYQRMIRPLDKDAPESVHMLDWPKLEYIDEELEELMEIARDIVSAAAAARQKAKLKLRWPVSRIIIESDRVDVAKCLERLGGIIRNMSNAKSLELGSIPKRLVVRPKLAKLGPKFRGKAKLIAEELEKLDGATVKKAFESTGKYKLRIGDEEYEILPDDVDIEEQLPENFVGEDFKGGKVYVDITMTPELLSESYARELVRRIQEMRKQLDLDIEENIKVYLDLPEEMRKAIEPMLEYIRTETRAIELYFEEPKGYVKEWNINGLRVIIGIERLAQGN